jgi:hypothetical protein
LDRLLSISNARAFGQTIGMRWRALSQSAPLSMVFSFRRHDDRASDCVEGEVSRFPRGSLPDDSAPENRRIDARPYARHDVDMVASRKRRVTVNLPDDLLREAEQVTGKGITETLIAGLTLLARRRAYTKAQALRGKLDLRIDLDASRERARR